MMCFRDSEHSISHGSETMNLRSCIVNFALLDVELWFFLIILAFLSLKKMSTSNLLTIFHCRFT